MLLKDLIELFRFKEREYFILVKKDGKELFSVGPLGFEFFSVDYRSNDFKIENPVVCFNQFLFQPVCQFYVDETNKNLVVEI